MIINLTPHTINLPDQTILPSGDVARVDVDLSTTGYHDGVTIVRGQRGNVTGLPDQTEGTLLIVSAMVRCALPERNDLASPAMMVRDDQGRITGCEALEIS